MHSNPPDHSHPATRRVCVGFLDSAYGLLVEFCLTR